MKGVLHMPFINSKISCKLDADKQERIKTALGQIITTVPGKSENFLMVGFEDEYELYFGGNKLDKGAFVEVRIFGSTSDDILEKLTGQICALYEQELGIAPNNVYVTYDFVNHWGWNGSNF